MEQGAAARDSAEARRRAEVARARAARERSARLRRWTGRTNARVDSPLRRARARRWLPVLVLLVVAHAAVWLLSDSTTVRLTALGVTALAAPLLHVWVTDGARGRRTGYRRRP